MDHEFVFYLYKTSYYLQHNIEYMEKERESGKVEGKHKERGLGKQKGKVV